MKMIFIYYFIFLISSNNLIFSETEARVYKIQYNNFLNIIKVEESFKTNTDKFGKISLQVPNGTNFRISSIKVVSSEKEIQSLYSININKIYIKTKSEFTVVTLNIKFEIDIGIRREFMLSDDYLYIPVNFISKTSIYDGEEPKKCNYQVSIITPKNWEVFEFGNDSSIIKKENETFFFEKESITSPIFLLGKKKDLVDTFSYKDMTTHKIYGNQTSKRFIFKTLVERDIFHSEVNKVEKFVLNYLGIDKTQGEINFVSLDFINLCTTLTNCIVLSQNYVDSVINEEPSIEKYIFIHNFVMFYLSNKTNPNFIEKNHWILQGIAHNVAMAFFKKNYNLGIYQITEKLKLFTGDANSVYARSKNIFRVYFHYNSIKSIAENNRSPLIDYNYKAKAINENQSIQVFENLKNILGQDEFKDFLKYYLKVKKYKYLNTSNFIEEIENFKNEEAAEIISEFIYSYPTINYFLVRTKNNIILEKQGKCELPVEVEIIYKNGKSKRKVVFFDEKKMFLDINPKDVDNVLVDPDNVIEEINEMDNFLYLQQQFGFTAPLYYQNAYNFALNIAVTSYGQTTYLGESLAGGWNLKSFNNNSFERPQFLFGVECGPGISIATISTNPAVDYFINTFFESPIFPMSRWSPFSYSNIFLTSEVLLLKTGLQMFIPPVFNTEFDNFYLFHSVDFGVDFRDKFIENNTVSIEINSGYKNLFKINFFSCMTMLGLNFDITNSSLRSIGLSGFNHLKFNFYFFEFGNKIGFIRSFDFSDQNYDYIRPRISRLSLVGQTIGIFENIQNETLYPTTIGLNKIKTPYDDFIFESFYTIFKITIIKEPLLDPLVTLGLGAFFDNYLSVNQTNSISNFTLVGAIIKIDLFKSTSVVLKFPIWNPIFDNGKIDYSYDNFKFSLFFEIKSML